jgi:hypothetical protein
VLALTGLLAMGCGQKPPTNGPASSAAPSTEPAPTTAAATTDAPTASAESTATAAPTTAKGEPLFVSEKRADCMGEGPMKRLQVRPNESAEWTLLYQPIEGFTYEEGNAYELRVERKPTANPPADGSSVRMKLLEVVSKRKVD